MFADKKGLFKEFDVVVNGKFVVMLVAPYDSYRERNGECEFYFGVYNHKYFSMCPRFTVDCYNASGSSEDFRLATDDEKKEFIDTGKVPVNLLMSEDKGVIVDISGGGLRLFSKKQFEQGSIVNIIFTINVNGKEKKMSLAAKVVLSVLGQNYDNVYDNRMQFVNIRKEDTDDIVKYVFAQQRLMQQRERGL